MFIARAATLAAIGIRTIPAGRVRAYYLRAGRVFRDGERRGDRTVELVRCGRCVGRGIVYGYAHVDGGACYGCGGRGVRERATAEARAIDALLCDSEYGWDAVLTVSGDALKSAIRAIRSSDA